MSIEHFSSLPPEEERHFVVFEEFSRANAKRANIIGWGVAGAFFVALMLIVSAYWGTAPKPALEEEAAAETVPGTAPTPAPAAPAPAPVPTDTAPAGAAPATATPPAAPAATPQ